MKLINADKIKEELKLKELSHIIKQEEYLDYVLNEWKTRVVELGSYSVIEEIDNALEVKAIPIEWIKKQIENSPYSHSYELGERWKGEYDTCLMVLLEDWEKENES